VAGDTGASGYPCLGFYTGTNLILLNPATGISASATVRGTVELSTAAEFMNDTADRVLTGETVWDAAGALTPLPIADTVAVDMATFINSVLPLNQSCTLGQPSNTKIGQSGYILLIQDATGSRTMAFHADWRFAGGVDPVLSTAANTIDCLFYQVLNTNFVYATLVKAIA
jgi:hypothetical protein